MKRAETSSAHRNRTPSLPAAASRLAGLHALRLPAVAVLAVLFLAACPGAAHAQVAASGNQGGLILSAGGTATASTVQYGQRKLLGFTAFADADTLRRFGLVFETSQMLWHQSDDVHLSTYSGGIRYHFDFGRFQPYVKGLAGEGLFNFPYNYASGHYLVVTGGAGLDYRLTRHIYVRAADFEYQDWPQFTYGNMNNFAVGAGIRVQFLGGR